MKRITFKPDFVPLILSGQKRHTSRWGKTPERDPLEWPRGDFRAAVTGKDGKPAFLTPAVDAFAVLRLDSKRCMFWTDFTEEHARLCGVTRDWYLKERPDAKPFDEIWIYEFCALDMATREPVWLTFKAVDA